MTEPGVGTRRRAEADPIGTEPAPRLGISELVDVVRTVVAEPELWRAKVHHQIARRHYGRPGSGRLLQRRIPRGRVRSFGPGYVHNLANAGPGLATSIHAYTPRLTTMTYYAVLPGGAVPIRSLPVDCPEPTVPH